MRRLSIAFIADTNFFLPTIVAITSLLENKKKESVYKVYIVNVGFTTEQKQIVSNISLKYNTEIVISDVQEEELKKRYSNLVHHDCSASQAALIKFDLPYICSDEENLLYMDGDIIVKQDLMKIAELTIPDDVYVMSVMDTGALYSANLKKQNKEQYFNSGVMYLNLKAMRRDDISKKLVEEKLKSEDHSLMDQHIFNMVFEHNKLPLEHKYNVLYVNLIRASFFYGLKIEQVNQKMNTEYKNWEDMLERAAIIHYSSFDKPWKYSDVDGVELWNKYYDISEVSSQKLNRKKLHIKTINKLRSHKITALLGSFIWELEIKGVKATIRDAFRFIKERL